MRRNGVVPPGRLGLIVLAVCAVPIVLKQMKPFVRWLGSKLSEAGDTVTKMAQEVDRPPYNPAAPAEAARKPGTAAPTSQAETPTADAPQQKRKTKSTPKAGTKGATAPKNNPKRARPKPKPA